LTAYQTILFSARASNGEAKQLELLLARPEAAGKERMTTPLKSSTSSPKDQAKTELPGWFKLGVVTAASALVGGLAAAWWYRKTLEKLREGPESTENPDFRISAPKPDEEDPDFEGEGL
jgi:hypothetical protein